MIRKARPDDVQEIVKLGIEALKENHAYDNLVISRERIEATARACISSASNFAFVAERDGVVMGAVCAQTHDFACFERQSATVAMCYCRIPGEGIKLLREFLRWARSRPVIKLISFTPELNADPRIRKMLHRLGLQTTLPSYIEIR